MLTLSAGRRRFIISCQYLYFMNHIVFVFTIFGFVQIHAQDSLFATGRITYVRDVRLAGEIASNGVSTLDFNPLRSIFILNDAPKSDTTLHFKDLGYRGSVVGDPTGFPILKYHRERRIIFKLFVLEYEKDDLCILSDTFATTVWTIDATQTRTIGGFTCEKATGHYRGRDYEVWYAPDIPIPSGPFKLGGLPGLIMEACSIDKKVLFLFNSLEFPLRSNTKIEFPRGGFNPGKNYAQALDYMYKSMQDLEKKAAAIGTIITITPLETIELNANN